MLLLTSIGAHDWLGASILGHPITTHLPRNVPANRPTSEQKASIQVNQRFMSCWEITSNFVTEDAKALQSVLSQVDAVSTVPQDVRGDWVLFHPVYSQEEMKSVEVRRVVLAFMFDVALTICAKILHKEATTISDKLIYKLTMLMRFVSLL